MNHTYRVRILHYDERERKFSRRPAVFVYSKDDHEGSNIQELSVNEVSELGLTPSTEFMHAYAEWNSFENHPVFDSSKDLIEFNAKGHELVTRLQQELPDVSVDPFEPLYTSLELGNCISGWWHIKDRVYGCILPVQQLPVSDDLKSKLMAWRHHKCMDWLNQETVQAVNEEGQELEEHLLWELNVRELLRDEMDKEMEKMRHPPARSDSVESVGWECRLSRQKQTRDTFKTVNARPESERVNA